MKDDYEFVDTITTIGQGALDGERTIYIPRDVFDQNVERGQETLERVRLQMRIDVPRSKFCMDGKEWKRAPSHLPLIMSRYCTQVVMAYPVEMLSNFGIVAEYVPHQPLQIDVWGNVVHVRKNLRVFDGERWIRVRVKVVADMHDPCVLLKVRIQDHISKLLPVSLAHDCEQRMYEHDVVV